MSETLTSRKHKVKKKITLLWYHTHAAPTGIIRDSRQGDNTFGISAVVDVYIIMVSSVVILAQKRKTKTRVRVRDIGWEKLQGSKQKKQIGCREERIE